MDETKQAWQDVGDRFARLGDVLKERLDTGEDKRAVEDALRTLGDAAERLGFRVAGAVQDPAVKQTLQDAARTLWRALSTTFSDVGDELGGRFRAGRSPSEEDLFDDTSNIVALPKRTEEVDDREPPPDAPR